MNESNNKFYFAKDAKIIIPEGSYEDINEFLKRDFKYKNVRDTLETVDVVRDNNNNNDIDDDDGKRGEYPITRKLQHDEMRD